MWGECEWISEIPTCLVINPRLSFLSLCPHRCWRTPRGSAGWWSPPSLQSATLLPTHQLCPPHTTCLPIWLTHTLYPTPILFTPLSALVSCPHTSTTSTTSPPCMETQVLDRHTAYLWLNRNKFLWSDFFKTTFLPLVAEIISVYGMSNFLEYSKPQPKKIKEPRLERQNRLNSPPSTLYKGSLGPAHNGYRWFLYFFIGGGAVLVKVRYYCQMFAVR